MSGERRERRGGRTFCGGLDEPARIDLISGMPEPAAAGESQPVSPIASHTSVSE